MADDTHRLYAIATGLARALGAEQAARVVIGEARALVGAPAAAMLLLDDTRTRVHSLIVDGDEDAAAAVKTMPLEADMPICEAARTGKLVWICGADAIAARYPHLAPLRGKIDARTWGAVPILFEGVPLGSLGFRFSEERELSPDEVASLLVIGSQCAQALERARLHDVTQAARAEAERANRAKDEFLAMLGHELRNPLAPILTAVQLMRLRGDTTSAREQDVIERQVRHLIRLVDDLLDVSRIARGKVTLDRRPVKLAAIVARAVEIASPLCEERGHHVSVALPDADVWLDADETRLSQVVSNLLTNAAKYTVPGGRIAVRAAVHAGEIEVRVSDNGAGIAPELLPRVFELFVQGERESDRNPGGLGLGLALVKSLVELHGGRVVATSDGVGKGSELVVTLPVLAGAADAEAAVADGGVRAGVKVTARRILLVDDNHDGARLLGDILASVGHDVTVAHDGPGALAAVASFTPEIAVLDIGLPVMDGYELAAALRDRFGTGLRLIAVTGYGQDHDVARSHAAGFEHHFVKPLAIARLLAALEVDQTPR